MNYILVPYITSILKKFFELQNVSYIYPLYHTHISHGMKGVK
jgi:hypothetical protein